MRNGGPSAAIMFGRQRKINYVGMFRENGTHSIPQLTDPFSVNNSHFVHSVFPAELEIIQDYVLHIPGAKRVQIDHTQSLGILAYPVVLIVVLHSPLVILFARAG